jgi:hypothetical protein
MQNKPKLSNNELFVLLPAAVCYCAFQFFFSFLKQVLGSDVIGGGALCIGAHIIRVSYSSELRFVAPNIDICI